MFDFSFGELLLCFLVALVVLGPERMPVVARTVGRWTGKARTYMRNLSAELEREAQVSELKKQIEEAQRVLREQTQTIHSQAQQLAAEAKPQLDTPDKPAEQPKPPAEHV
jgi:sec-independent protein translocase protein TatB